MRFPLRAKLFAIAVTTAFAFVLLIGSSTVSSRQVSRELSRIEKEYLPKVELGPALVRRLEALTRGFQDAVAARDADDLAQTRALADRLLSTLSQGSQAVDAQQQSAIRAAVEQYYVTASDVSRRLIDGETGEALITSMTQMQAQQKRVVELIEAATSFDRGELTEAFATATRAESTAAQVRLTVSLACLVMVMMLLLSVGRSILRTLETLVDGLERFGTGSFEAPIAVTSDDELGVVASRANAMADNLRRLAVERDRQDWLKAGATGLLQKLSGEHTAEVMAERALSFFLSYLNAAAGALYYLVEPHQYRRLASIGVAEAPGAAPPSHFARNEGLVGQVAADGELKVVTQLPPQYWRVRSGLGDAPPTTLVLLPFGHGLEVRGVVELAFFGDAPQQTTELLLAAREALAVAIEMALARSQTKALLAETQVQANRLQAQEAELRANNEELESQQRELAQANEELLQKTGELEHQRTQLEQRNVELEGARRNLEQQTRELATVSNYKSQFLTNMSHELRTPLNSMLLLSNLLAEHDNGNLSPKQVEYCRTIHAAGQDLLALINQVLDLAKVEAGKQELHLAAVRVDELAQRARRIFEPLAKEKGVRFDIVVGPAVPAELVSDRQRVDQVITNLVGNAVKFTRHGSVTLAIDRVGPDVQLGRAELQREHTIAITVSDTGPGIADSDTQRIFTAFEQLDPTSSRRHGGSGLGLAIAREMAWLLGGELKLLRTAVGQGSTFVCYLPIETKASTLSRPPEAARVPNAPFGQAGRGSSEHSEPLLLLIEDDRVFADVFADIIRSQGLGFVLASDGHSGVALAKARRPSGILLDVKLPDMSGFEVFEALKQDPLTADIPVHFVSALPAAERGLALGAVGYLTKPTTRSDLMNVVRSLSARSVLKATPQRVLVLEPEHQGTAQSLVEQLSGEPVEVRRAANADAALRALEREQFGCMIVDLSMEGIDGLQLLNQVQAVAGAHMPAVVIYTSRALSREETQRLQAYADAIVLREGSSNERLVNEVRLFLRRLKEGAAALRAHQPISSAPVTYQLDGRRVLVVDDDMRTLYALSAMLRAKGAEVFVADNGRAALDVLGKTKSIEAVLMDIMMPEMDGYEAMRLIRATKVFAQLPIIALTAKAMLGDEQKCLDAGASAYLSKPIDADRLLPLLHRLLSSQQSAVVDPMSGAHS